MIILIIWEGLVRALSVPEYLLPAPSEIISTMISELGFFAGHFSVTMVEAISGFMIANLVGFGVGAIFAHSRTAERGLYPYAIALKTTPIIAMAPLLVIWIGTGIGSKVASAALICFFPILVNSVRGLRSVDDEAMALFDSLKASRMQIFTKLRFPNSLPFVFSALKISTSLSVVGAVVGEFVGANHGLGYVILVSSYHLETVRMFAATFSLAVGGVVFFGLISLLEKRFVYWTESEEK